MAREGDRIDFAALRVLKVVTELGSISIAARRLSLDQSTVSHTLSRLRRLFGDPLLVPGANGMSPTERCRDIVDEVSGLLETYDRLSAPRQFRPRTARFEVVISAGHAGRAVLFAPLLAFLRRFAPGIRLRFILAHTTPQDALASAICDLAVMPMPREAVSLHRRYLLSINYVCVVSRDGPYASGITREQYDSAEHVWNSFAASYLELPDPPRIVVDVPSLADIDLIIADTDLVATVPEPLARNYSERVAVIPAPLDLTAHIYLFWTDRTHDLLHMRWLRMLLSEIAGNIMRGNQELGALALEEWP